MQASHKRESLPLRLVHLVRQREEWQRLAMRDPLTGLYNRYYFEDRLDGEFERARRYKRPFSILMIDLDDFKKINDNYGHDAGDDVLRKIGEVLRTKTRRSDTQVRYGGEEFVLIIPESSLRGAIQVGNKLCREIRKLVFSTPTSPFAVTISTGVASSSAKPYSHWKEILKDADRALYKAKAGGKDCVRTAKREARVSTELRELSTDVMGKESSVINRRFSPIIADNNSPQRRRDRRERLFCLSGDDDKQKHSSSKD